MEEGYPQQEGCILPCVYMEKASSPTRAGSLCQVTWANYIYFPTKPGIPYLRTSFHFISYTRTNRACEIKSYLKNACQNKLCRVYGALICQPSQEASPLKCIYMENSQHSQGRSRQLINIKYTITIVTLKPERCSSGQWSACICKVSSDFM